jgi:O-antigen/teichoic acid export membrane protein
MIRSQDDSKKNTLISNIAWSFLAKVFAMLFYFIADVFYARFLGIDAYAEWVFFFSIANMTFCIGWFGINISSKVFIAKADDKSRCFGTALKVRVLFSSIIFIVIILLAPLIAPQIGYPEPYLNLKKLMYILSGMVFVNSFTEFFKHVYIGIQEYKNLCMITCIEYFLLCAFTVILLLTNNTPTSIALGYCTAGMATLLCNVFIFGRKYNIPRIWKDNRNRQLQKEIIKYSVPLVLTSLGGLVLVEMDTFMLGLFCPKQQVSVYSIAKQLISKATNVNMAVWTGTITSLAAITRNNYEEKKHQFKKVNRFNNAISILICMFFAMFGKFAIQIIYGTQYTDAGRILIFLIPYYFLFCVSSLYANFLDFMGHAKQRSLWFLSVIAINYIFNYLLIPKYAGIGAALATTISIVPYTIYCIYDVAHLFKFVQGKEGCKHD